MYLWHQHPQASGADVMILKCFHLKIGDLTEILLLTAK
jgi:hypothetical protein